MASGSVIVRRHKRISMTILLLVALTSAIGVGFAVQFAGSASHGTLEASAKETLQVQVQVLNGLMEKFRLLPNLVGRHPAISKVFSEPSEAALDSASLAIRHDAAMTGALDIVLLGLDGTLILSGTGVATDSIEPNSPLLSAVFQGRLGREARQFAPDDRAYVFASGLRGSSDELIGAIAVLVDLATLEQIWSLSTLPVLVVDGENRILASNRAQWRMVPLNLVQTRGGGQTSYELNGETRPVIDVMQELPELGWQLHVLADAAPIARAQLSAAAAVALGGLGLAVLLLNLMNRRLAVANRNRNDKANSLRLERVVRDRTKALTHSVSALAEEVEHHKSTENTLRQTQDELIQTGKLAALGQMSTALSHEFNQPLAATKSYADNALVLLERDRRDEAQENIRLISKMADRMAVISRHLRNFGRKPKSRLASISVSAVIEDAIEVLSARLKAEKGKVSVVHTSKDLWAKAGHVRLQQVVVNLISNALDTASSSLNSEVIIETGCRDKMVFIRVRDFGPGIDPANMEQIFDPFFTTKEPGQGLGLGLSISYNIVKDFGGRLIAANHNEQGAVFTVELEQTSAREKGAN